ncbi:hypothetical protein SCHPADRAFT_868710 [Schizopora paradoxa]|uniref:Endoplasmic reticulum junction formation protein lunapark n=1 Tax=Schizopora paradoxa TaxID=27342 RepID=A0A0H2S5T4_9AGAM|nr:hypothetical protein SCHPADRAFT_868710 [Schizopora paradoxa]
MGILSWFKKKEPEDYDQILSSLALDIQKRQAKLADIRLRERRTTTLVTLYAIATWVTYIGAWYLGMLPRAIASSGGSASFVKWLPIFLGPILVQLIRRIVQTWYERIGNSEEKTLKKLLSTQHNKVEEIKKKTNYYTTKNLIDKYDTTPQSTPVRQRTAGPQPPIPPQQRQQAMPMMTPQRPNQPNGQPMVMGPQSPNTSIIGLQGAATPMTPGGRKWYDRFADALLGDDELNMNNASTRYALICQKCFTHNGLVKEEELEDAQFRCMKCSHFNPSKRSMKSRPDGPSGSVVSSQGRPAGPRQSMSPTDISFDSAVSSSPNQTSGRPRPSALPKPPSPLSNTLDLSGDSSIEQANDSNQHSDVSMEIDA